MKLKYSLFITVLILLFSSISSYANVQEDIVVFYPLTDPVSNYTDLSGNGLNATALNSPTFRQDDFFGRTVVYMDDGADGFEAGWGDTDVSLRENLSYSMMVNCTTIVEADIFMHGTTGGGFCTAVISGGVQSYYTSDTIANNNMPIFPKISYNVWHHMVYTQQYNVSTPTNPIKRVYIDGVDVSGTQSSTALNNDINYNDNVIFGSHRGIAGPCSFFNMAVWNRTLTESEILGLNTTNGDITSVDIPITVTINSPSNGTNFNSSSIINFTVSEVNGTANCSLYDNDILIDTIRGLENTTTSFGFNDSYWFSGINLINISCTDNSDNDYESIELFVDVTSPTINFNSPADGGTITTNYTIINVTTEDTNNYLFNITVTYDFNNTVIYSNQTVNVSSTFNFYTQLDLYNYLNGNITINVTAKDAHTKNKIDFDKELQNLDWTNKDYRGSIIDDKVNTFGYNNKIKSFDLKKRTDRKIFEVGFYPGVSEFELFVEGEFSVEYLNNRYGYQGHFIIDDKYWYDLENNEDATVKDVIRLSENKYKIIMQKPTDIESITFNSIGIINTANSQITFSYEYVQISNCSNGYPAYNFSILNESDNQPVWADITGTFYDDSDNTYSLSITNRTNFSICVYPSNAATPGNYTLYYEASGFPQRRTYNPNAYYSNQTILKTLYLLPSNLGIYFRLRTIDNYESPISQANIIMEKYVSGSYIEIERQNTDDSGIATFWVNPDDDYRFTASKTGYGTETVTLRPTSTDIYTLTLSSSTQQGETPYGEGIVYDIDPKGILNNNTGYNFTFNLTSSYWSITDCWLELYNGSTKLTNSSNTYSTSQCFITIDYDTNGYNNILLYGNYQLNNTFNDTKIVNYKIKQSYTGDNSLKVFLDDLTDFGYSGFDSFGRGLLALFAILLLLYYTKRDGAILEDNSNIVLFLIGVWFFSYINWLYLDYNRIPVVFGLDLKQYIIFIVLLLAGLGLIMRNRE